MGLKRSTHLKRDLEPFTSQKSRRGEAPGFINVHLFSLSLSQGANTPFAHSCLKISHENVKERIAAGLSLATFFPPPFLNDLKSMSNSNGINCG